MDERRSVHINLVVPGDAPGGSDGGGGAGGGGGGSDGGGDGLPSSLNSSSNSDSSSCVKQNKQKKKHHVYRHSIDSKKKVMKHNRKIFGEKNTEQSATYKQKVTIDRGTK